MSSQNMTTQRLSCDISMYYPSIIKYLDENEIKYKLPLIQSIPENEKNKYKYMNIIINLPLYCGMYDINEWFNLNDVKLIYNQFYSHNLFEFKKIFEIITIQIKRDVINGDYDQSIYRTPEHDKLFGIIAAFKQIFEKYKDNIIN